MIMDLVKYIDLLEGVFNPNTCTRVIYVEIIIGTSVQKTLNGVLNKH